MSAERAFVGRAWELGELSLGLEAAVAGQGRLFLLVGEPGIGKTRLAEEIAVRASQRGACVLRGGCWEGGGAPPFWPWMQVLRARLREAPSEETAFAELRDLLPAASLGASNDSEESRFRLFDAVAGVLRESAKDAPVVVLLDDLQWADESSLLLLGFLTRSLRDARVLLVGAYRDVEARLSAEVARHLDALACDAQTIRVGGLSRAEVSLLVEHTRGLPETENLAETIRATTDGNPLFVEEVLRALVARGRFDEAGSSAALPVPERVRAVIGRRMRLVSDPCRRILSVAAVLGKEIDRGALEHVLAALGDPALGSREALSETLDRAIVEATDARILVGSGARCSFAHDLFRETLYDDLGAGERARLHGVVGEALESFHEKEIDLWLAELAHHFLLAGPAHAESALRYSERAAERAALGFAHSEAVRHHRRALEALAAFGAKGSARRCRTLLRLGESLWSAGEFEEARRVYEEAADLAEALDLAPELARAALGFGGQDVSFDGGVVEPRLIRLLEKAVARVGDADTALRASLTARLAAALAYSDQRARGAVLAREAVAIARRLGDKSTLHFALSCFLAATWGPDDLEERLAVSRETARLAGEIGGVGFAEMHAALMTFLLESGDLEGAEREAEAYRVRNEIPGRRISRWILAVRRAMIALLQGRFAEVERLASEALELGSARQNRNAVQYYGAQLLALRREQGRLGEVVEAIERFAVEVPAVPAWRASLAWAYVELGREAEAHGELERLAAKDFADLPRDMFWLLCLWLLADVAGRLEDERRAEILYELLRPFAGRCVTSGAAFCGGSAERSLGVLATVLRRYEDAARRFEAALVVHERIGARPWSAYVEHDFARMLLRRAGEGDVPAAVERLRRAESAARELGMTSLLARVESLLAEVTTASTATSARGEGEEAVLRPEGEYWTLSYAGRAARVRDARGLRLIALLLASPGRDFRATELAAWPAPPSAADAASLAREAGLHTGDATLDEGGPDAKALAAYRSRLARLREEAEEAERFNDPLRATQAREEIARLAEEVSASRRRRRTGGVEAERARLSVTKAIRYAIRKVESAHPALGRLLVDGVKTGATCRYEPGSGSPVRWIL